MKGYRQVALRLLWAGVSVWLVLTLVWLFVALTGDPNKALGTWGAAVSGENGTQAARQYDAARGRTGSLLSQYFDVMEGLVTLQWGISVQYRQPVVDVVARALVVTASYVLPAILVAVPVGGALGVFAAVRRDTLREKLVLGLGYLGVSLPSFAVAVFAQRYVVAEYGLEGTVADTSSSVGPVTIPGLAVVTSVPARLAIASLVVAGLLLASQIRYARSETLEHLGTAYVKTARAKGAADWRVARHAVRNAGLALVSLLFADLMGVLVVSIVVVEVVLNVPGLGSVLYRAADARDIPLLLGASLVPVTVGVLANFFQDLAVGLFDPRVGDD